MSDYNRSNLSCRIKTSNMLESLKLNTEKKAKATYKTCMIESFRKDITSCMKCMFERTNSIPHAMHVRKDKFHSVDNTCMKGNIQTNKQNKSNI